MGKPNPQNLRAPWPKGVSGNPKGKPPTKAMDEVFKEFLAEIAKSPKGEMKERLKTLMEGQFYAAVKGSTPAAEFLMNRAHGKIKQVVENTGKDGGKIEHDVTHHGLPATAEFLERIKSKRG